MMTTERYDEDLTENSLFVALQGINDGTIFHDAAINGWLICIPRQGCLTSHSKSTSKKKNKAEHEKYDEAFMLRHVLIPSDDLEEGHYNTLDDSEVRISGDVISIAEKGMDITMY